MFIVCEPECRGLSHIEFNYYTIFLLSRVYQGEKILLLAEHEHQRLIYENIKKFGIQTTVSYKEIVVTDTTKPYFTRLAADKTLIAEVFDKAIGLNVDKIFFLSCTSTNLHYIKKYARKMGSRYKVFVFVHGILETVSVRPSFRPHRWPDIPFWFGFFFLSVQPTNIRYILLSPSIRNNLLKKYPFMKSVTTAIDLPYFFPDARREGKKLTFPIKMGTLGILNYSKGGGDFLRFYDAFAGRIASGMLELAIVGYINDEKLKKLIPREVTYQRNDEQIDRNLFSELADNLHYALFFYGQNTYKLTASAALLDVFLFLKPVIAIKNSITSYYFSRFGDIGYLCDTLEEMIAVAEEIINDPPVDRYDLQVNNLLNARKILGTDNMIRQLNAAVS